MLPDGLLELVRERWSLGDIRRPNRIAGGEWNDVWRIETASGAFVLRLSNPQLSSESVRWEHALLQRLAAELPVVAAPVFRDDGHTLAIYRGRVLTVFPCLPGAPPPASHATRKLAAVALGRMHAVLSALGDLPPRPQQPALAALDWENNFMWDWSAVRDRLRGGPEAIAGTTVVGADWPAFRYIARNAAYIAAERERTQDWVQRTVRRQPLTGVIHGDFFRRNLLVEDDVLRGVVDWDEAHPDWLAYELGWAAWEFCHRQNATLALGALEAFVRTYRENGGPVPAVEDDLLVPSIRCRHLIEVLWALGRGAFDARYCAAGIAAMKQLDAG